MITAPTVPQAAAGYKSIVVNSTPTHRHPSLPVVAIAESWNNIFDDPVSDHSMLPQVIQVMQCIYILNLREGESDYPNMDTHFMINLNTMRVHDKFQDHRFPVPQEILSVLGQLKLENTRGALSEADGKRKRRENALHITRHENMNDKPTNAGNRQSEGVAYMVRPMRVNFHHLESTDAADLLNMEKRFQNDFGDGDGDEAASREVMVSRGIWTALREPTSSDVNSVTSGSSFNAGVEDSGRES
ncbi:hypothetical protein EDD22DRAFT_853635 [Suillus occidentalis]|nr:hypothetical protein EDD22DRAFT_853635 [Suillus occidentalis]